MFGVDLFFVLSGYLITKILLNARENAPAGQRITIVKNFYIRRALRIFPIYFLYLFIVGYVLKDSSVRDNIGYFVTYTTNFLMVGAKIRLNTHTWSLAVEEQFYLVWPWVIIYTPKKYLFRVIVFSILIGIGSGAGLCYLYGTGALYLLLPCITAFSMGALYAYVASYPEFRKPVLTVFKWLLPVCVILLFISQAGYYFTWIRAVNSIIAISLIIYISRQNYNPIARFVFNNRLMVSVGKISYGIYLYHYMLPFFYREFIHYLQGKILISDRVVKILIYPPPGYLIQVALVLLIAGFSYTYIELNFLKLKKYFLYRQPVSEITPLRPFVK